jgi:hypothetical protein
LRSRRVATVAATAVCAASLLAPSSADGASVPTRSVSAVNGGYLTTYSYGAGDTAQVFDARSPVTITISNSNTPAAAKGTSPTQYSMGMSVTPTNPISAAGKGTVTPLTGVPSSASIVAQMGAPADVVGKFAHEDALDKAALSGAATANSSARASTTGNKAAVASGTLYNTECIGKHFHGSYGSFYGCTNQYIALKNGGDWTMMDHFYSSASMHSNGGQSLTGLEEGVTYQNDGNEMRDWNPKQTSTGGSCQTISAGLTAYGLTLSDSYTACPEVYGEHYVSRWSYYTKWDGQHEGPNNGSRETGGVDRVHNPPGSSPTYQKFQIIVWWE